MLLLFYYYFISRKILIFVILISFKWFIYIICLRAYQVVLYKYIIDVFFQIIFQKQNKTKKKNKKEESKQNKTKPKWNSSLRRKRNESET